jgi:transcriptional accessory protein Tex/SPT6
LVHISELSHKYIQDAREAVKVGDIVKVKVIGVDQGMKRISLSMKALMPKPPRPPRRKKGKPEARPAAAAAAPGGPRAQDGRPAPERRPMRDARPQKPRPEGAPRPAEGKPRPPRPQKPQVERTTPGPALTMEEMIQALQAKFSGMK